MPMPRRISRAYETASPALPVATASASVDESTMRCMFFAVCSTISEAERPAGPVRGALSSYLGELDGLLI